MNFRSFPVAALSLAALFSLQGCSTETGSETPSKASVEDASIGKADGQAGTNAQDENGAAAGSGIYALQAQSLAGEAVDMSNYKGKVSLVVNVASQCGYTRQYAGLQKLHEEFAGQGFQVLGFPCNDFGGQEPGSAEEIGSFCRDKFGVTFPMFAKVKVKGDGVSPVYERLVSATGKTPGWNFCKYLVDKDGKVLQFFNSGASPDSAELRDAIAKAL